MQLQYVSPDALTEAIYNPTTRTNAKVIKPLVDSIREYGILEPLKADKNMNLIDGHRRLKAAKALGKKSVPVLILNMTPDAGYLETNQNQRRHKLAEWLQIYVAGGPVPDNHVKLIEKLEKAVGVNNLKMLASQGISPSIYREGIRVFRYVKGESDTYLKKIILWMAAHSMQYPSRRYIEENRDERYEQSVDRLLNCINSNRPLQQTWK